MPCRLCALLGESHACAVAAPLINEEELGVTVVYRRVVGGHRSVLRQDHRRTRSAAQSRTLPADAYAFSGHGALAELDEHLVLDERHDVEFDLPDLGHEPSEHWERGRGLDVEECSR